jgi:hypothetical protein
LCAEKVALLESWGTSNFDQAGLYHSTYRQHYGIQLLGINATQVLDIYQATTRLGTTEDGGLGAESCKPIPFARQTTSQHLLLSS